MASENVLDWTVTNWITVSIMVIATFLVFSVIIAIYSKFKGGATTGDTTNA